MARSVNFLQVFEAYVAAFPETAWMPDSRSMAGEDFDNLEALMKLATKRGTPLSPDDLIHPVPEPDAELGQVF